MYRTHIAGELFDKWNQEKKHIHSSIDGKMRISPREVWYIKLWVNIGNEQNGKWEFRRPVLVVRRIGNMYFCIPLTTKWKDDHPFYLPLVTKFENRKSYLITSQGRVFDKKRFTEYIWKIIPEEFQNIKNLLRKIYFWEDRLLPTEVGDLHRVDSR